MGLLVACWEGYVQKGFKIKNGKRVPNCVPKSGGVKSAKKSSKTKVKSK
jgi:hypothetical protein